MVLLPSGAAAQVGGDRSGPVSVEGGPLGEVSRPVSEGSRPVHDGARTIGETSGGPVGSGPVHDPGTRSMISGPVSEVSRGPMTEPRPLRSGGTVTEASAGAVKHDIDRPLGDRISQPLRELGPLQDRLRAIREGRVALPAEPALEPEELPSADGGDFEIDAAEDGYPAPEAADSEPDDTAVEPALGDGESERVADDEARGEGADPAAADEAAQAESELSD